MHIKIKNISRKVTADSLNAVFSTHGQVLTSTLLPAAKTGDRSRMALVHMPNLKEATAAIQQLNGCFVDGQKMILEQVTDRSATPFWQTVVRHCISAKKLLHLKTDYEY